MSIFKLVFSNFRKRKGASITFLTMVMISAIMLSVSLSLMIGGASFFEKKVEALNAPHYTSSVLTPSYRDEFETFAREYSGVTDVSVVNSILTSYGTWHFKSSKSTNSVLIFDEKEANSKSFYKPSVTGSQGEKGYDMIILPVSFRYEVKAGEKISLSTNASSYQFTVYGFFEDAVTGSSTTGANSVYIGSENFSVLQGDENFTQNITLSARFEKGEMSRQFRSDFNRFAKLSAMEEFYMSYDDSKMSAMLFIDIISLILILFSLIILMIALIVARFSIINSIHEDMTTIGALKGLGYKTKTLKLSRLIEFVSMAALGSLLGSLLSLLSFGFLGNIIASTSGLLWLNNVNILPIILAVAIICLLTSVVICIAVRKYKRITPISALRQLESSRNTRKNRIPLEKYKMPLSLHLGVKRTFGLIKNNITLCVVVSLVVFISVLVNSISYNLNEDRTAMIQMVGLEMAELYVQVMPAHDIYEINDEIKSDSQNIKYTLLNGSKSATLDEYETVVATIENYSALTTNTIIKGRYPNKTNEITLGAVTAAAVKKGLNDTVTVEIDGIESGYVVVGITQNIASAGEGCAITQEAMIAQCPSFRMDTIYLYLNEGINTSVYHDLLKLQYGNKILTADTNEQMDTILSSLGDPLAAVSIIMIVITITIIAFVLFLIISAMIRKQKKEFGIMKAVGFKNGQLILQTIISFMPSLIIGTILGTIFGFILTNPLISLLFSSAGLLKTYFIIPVFSTFLISAGILFASILMSYVISLRLRRISPQKLITEQ